MDKLTPGVQRVLKRDDLLQLAYEAESAVSIAKASPQRDFEQAGGDELFQRALDIHLDNARAPVMRRYTRAQFLAYAGKIVEFCAQVGHRLRCDRTAVELFTAALEAASPADGSRRARLRREPTRAVLTAHLAARSLRLAGEERAAARLVARPEGYFFATGVEHIRGRYEYELTSDLLVAGQARQVRHALSESERYWKDSRAASFVDRHRYRYALAMTDWQLGDLAEAERALRTALDELYPVAMHADGSAGSIDDWRDVCELSLRLALAELVHLAGSAAARPRTAEAVQLLRIALRVAVRLRARWRVVVRSRSPLSIVIRRIWGDMALLADTLDSPDAAALGAEIAMSAKQSGFASLMRAERSALADNPLVLGVLDAIQEREALVIDAQFGIETADQLIEQLNHNRRELRDQIDPMLAEFVLPSEVDLTGISKRLGGRLALDLVGLPDTLSNTAGEVNWFRTMFAPGVPVAFDRLQPGQAFGSFFTGPDRWIGRLDEVTASYGPNWQLLAREMLPAALLARLDAGGAVGQPLELVISGHGRLSHLPWPALQTSSGTRLIDLAVISQALSLTCLRDDPLPAVSGPALIRLVGEPVPLEDGYLLEALDIRCECQAWQLQPPEPGRSAPLSAAATLDSRPSTISGTFAGALARGRKHGYNFAHVAAHGRPLSGLAQQIRLPEMVSAGTALTMLWPESVLMACCNLGRVANLPDEEPFGFVICLLSAGARCAVVGLDDIDDEATGHIAQRIVEKVKSGMRLDRALREAQSRYQNDPVRHWALLTSYVC